MKKREKNNYATYSPTFLLHLFSVLLFPDERNQREKQMQTNKSNSKIPFIRYRRVAQNSNIINCWKKAKESKQNALLMCRVVCFKLPT